MSRGAILVNPRKGGGKSVPLRALFAAVGSGSKKNPLVTNRRKKGGKSSRRNPGMSKKSRAKMSALATIRPRNAKGQFLRMNGGKKNRRNPLVTNRGGRRGGRRRSRRNPLITNPLVTNRRRSRRNPLITNPLGGILASVARPLSRIPFVGGMLAASVMSISGAITGAIGVVPIHYALNYAGEWVPERLKPVAYSLGGVLLAGAVAAFAPANTPYKGLLVAAMASAGGAVDSYRMLEGSSSTLSGEGGYGGDHGDYGYDGVDDFGDDENVRPAEWADAYMTDAEMSGDDLSDEEAEYGARGRRAFRKRFWRSGGGGQRHNGQTSHHAGTPGGRWGWLIYWVGPEQFKAMSQLPPAQRKAVIARARHAAMATAQQAIQSGSTDGDLSMESMEAAGLLVT